MLSIARGLHRGAATLDRLVPFERSWRTLPQSGPVSSRMRQVHRDRRLALESCRSQYVRMRSRSTAQNAIPRAVAPSLSVRSSRSPLDRTGAPCDDASTPAPMRMFLVLLEVGRGRPATDSGGRTPG